MLGAIASDVIGSVYEHHQLRQKSLRCFTFVVISPMTP